MTKPKITFLMLAYNTEKYIEKAVNSILNQTETNINLIVRNNGSTDKTGDLLRQMAASDERMHIIENKNNWYADDGSCYIASGIVRIWPIQNKELLGEYISIVDSDDWLRPDFAERLYQGANDFDADIAVCGHTYMHDGITKGSDRLPPDLCTENLANESERIRTEFMSLYNVFRCYWGKLFKTTFFLKHYDEAWQSVGDRSLLDTATMLRYLRCCRGFASVCEPLYQFRVSTATYKSRFPDGLRVMEAETLWEEGWQFLSTFGAHSDKTDRDLLCLNYAYMDEYLSWIKIKNDESGFQQLAWLALTGNSSVIAKYIRDNEDDILNIILPYTSLVFSRDENQLALFASYLVRLLYVETLMQQPDNPLLMPLLVSCLSDIENSNLLGLTLLEKLPQKTKGLQYILDNEHFMQKKSTFNLWMVHIEKEDDTAEVKTLGKEMMNCFEKDDYAKTCDLMEQISKISPCNRDAMYIRINMAVLAENIELATILGYTARILWPYDVKMQKLCWGVAELKNN